MEHNRLLVLVVLAMFGVVMLAVFCLSFVVVATSKDEQAAFQCDACGYVDVSHDLYQHCLCLCFPCHNW